MKEIQEFDTKYIAEVKRFYFDGIMKMECPSCKLTMERDFGESYLSYPQPGDELNLYFYCDRWEIITDKTIPIDGFRSSERWQLAAMDIQGNTLALFPGCQIKAWLSCKSMPPTTESICYYIK